jgi:hypothetical protein
MMQIRAAMQPSWSKPLARPLMLRNGTVLRTLRDARHFIAMLPEDFHRRSTWRHVAQLLWDAAENATDSRLVGEATLRLRRALSLEGRLTRIDLVSSTLSSAPANEGSAMLSSSPFRRSSRCVPWKP